MTNVIAFKKNLEKPIGADVKRIHLVDRLNDALESLYHNATPRYPYLESDYEQDLFNSWFEDHASLAIADLKHDDMHGPFVEQYGPVYQYGRGGRTLAPSKLMRRYGSRDGTCKAEDLDVSPLEARALLRWIEAFNRDVNAWCKDVPSAWMDAVEANEWQSAIDENKGKRRRIKTVTVYEGK